MEVVRWEEVIGGDGVAGFRGLYPVDAPPEVVCVGGRLL
jgi:hypothetical protein